MSFVISQYAVIILFGLLSYIIGREITHSCVYHSSPERITICTSLGIGSIGSLIFILGLLHALYRPIVFACLIAITSCCWRSWKELAQELNCLRLKPERVMLFVFVIIAIVAVFRTVFLAPLYPPTAFDAIMYHLPIATSYLAAHSLAFQPFIRFSSFPQLNEMLFALMLMTGGDVSAQLVEMLMMLLITLATYAWAYRCFSKRTGVVSAVMWISNPIVIWLSASAYVDLGATLFVCLGMYCFFIWLKEKERTWLLGSACFLGFGSGVKYTALFPTLMIGLILAFMEIRQRRFRTLAVFGVIILAIAGPWYLRNYHYTGNPFFPNFGSVFGYGQWGSADVHSELAQQTGYGAGKTFRALLLLPWNLAFKQGLFTHGTNDLSTVYIFLFPIVTIAAIRDKRLRPLLALASVMTLFWFFTVQITRFLLPAFPLFSILAGAALEDVVSWIPYVRRVPSAAVTSSLALPFLFSTWMHANQSKIPTPLPTTTLERTSYLNSRFPSYAAYEWLHVHGGETYVVYALGDEHMRHFAAGRSIGDWFGPARYSLVLDSLKEPKVLYDRLSSMGANFLLINQSSFDSKDWGAPSLLPALDDGFVKSHFHLVFARAYVWLFEVSGEAPTIVSSSELLRNPDFAKLTDGQPDNWRPYGKPGVVSDQSSCAGNVAVKVDNRNWFSQTVPVQSGSLYILRNAAHIYGKKEFGRMQVNWLDRRRKFLRADIELVEVGPQCDHHVMAATAPQGAEWAEVYASVQSGDVWFDNFSFTSISSQ